MANEVWRHGERSMELRSGDSTHSLNPNDIESIHSHLKSMVASCRVTCTVNFGKLIVGLDTPIMYVMPAKNHSSRQPTVSLLPSIDIDQLKDPVEYFLAYQKYENAIKELQRHGVLTDLDQNNSFRTEGRRGPGIMRRSVRFKRRQWLVLSNNDETCNS